MLGAIRLGQLAVFEHLVKDSRTSLKGMIPWAAIFGQLAIIERLLQLGANPTDTNNSAIINAAESGYVDITKLLLQDKRVNPASQRNKAIILACTKGHIDIVKILLNDKRVDPTAQRNAAYRGAIKKGHTSVAELLLTDERVAAIMN